MLILAFAFAIVGFASASELWERDANVDHLIPLKRELPKISARNLHLHAETALMPQAKVEMHYGRGSDDRLAATLQYTACKDRPIVLLEDLDHLVEVKCSLEDLILKFNSAIVYEVSKHQWDTEFIIVSSHEGCNPEFERTPYHVVAVIYDDKALTATLIIDWIPWEQVGTTMHVDFGHIAEKEVATRGIALRKRDDISQNWDHLFNSTFNHDLGPRQQLYPLPIGEIINATLNDTHISNLDVPLDIPDFTIGLDTGADDFVVTCIDCFVHSSFKLGGSFDIHWNIFNDTRGDDDNSTASKIFQTIDFGLILNDFDAKVQLEFFAGLTFDVHYTKELFPRIPILGYKIPYIFDLGPMAGVRAEMGISFADSVNFTYGGELNLPTNTSVSVNLLNQTEEAVQTGWGDVQIHQTPFLYNIGELSVTAYVSLAPFVEFGLSVGHGAESWSGGGDIIVTLPKLAVTFNPENVNAECLPPNATDFETYPAVNISSQASISIDAAFVLSRAGKIIHENSFNVYSPDAWPIGPSFCLSRLNLDEGVTAAENTLVGLESAAPNIDWVGLAAYITAHNTSPPGFNVAKAVNNTGFSGLPASVQSIITGTSTGLGQTNDKKNGAANGLRPFNWLTLSTLFVVLIL